MLSLLNYRSKKQGKLRNNNKNLENFTKIDRLGGGFGTWRALKYKPKRNLDLKQTEFIRK